MCEYCGCQEIATIGELTREHDAVVAEISIVRRRPSEGNLDAAALTTLESADWVRVESVRATVGTALDPERPAACAHHQQKE